MTNDQYRQTQFALVELARAISALDLDSLRDRINAALSAGPVMDPTLYREAHVRLEAIDHLAAEAIRLRGAFKELMLLALAEFNSIASAP